MGSNKETLKKTIVAECSQFIKHNRKHRKRKYSVKQWLADYFPLQVYFSLLCVLFSLLSRFEFLFWRRKFLFNLRRRLSFHSFLETMLVAKRSREIFWNLIDVGFKKRWKKYTKKKKKMHKMIKQLLTPFTWRQIFL